MVVTTVTCAISLFKKTVNISSDKVYVDFIPAGLVSEVFIVFRSKFEVLRMEVVMSKIGFDAEKYIEEQSKYILERIQCGNSERLYLEFGGKLVQDKHAMRYFPALTKMPR